MGWHRLHSQWIFPLNGPNLETPSQTCPEICLLSDFRSCQVGTVNLRDAQKPRDPGSHPGHCRDSTGNGCKEVWEADMVGWTRIWRLWDSEKQYLKDSAEFL